MKPSFSLILFTVSSGAGFGLFMVLVVVNGLGIGTPLAASEVLTAGGLALVLAVVGLVSSTLHLANPKNAVKAFNRFRSSWLSREGVFSLLFFPFAIAYLAGIGMTANDPGPWIRLAGWAAVAIAVATVFSTGMIYASLKTIRQWHNPLVPAGYLLMGPATGAVLLAAVRAFHGAGAGAVAGLAAVLLLAGAVVKLVYYFWIGRPAGPTLGSAIGFSRGRARLLDVGHSHGTFLTDEFGHAIGPMASRVLRAFAVVVGFLVPLALLLTLRTEPALPVLVAALAVIASFAGIFVERWLFLIEGRHVVNLYHGAQRT